jgi:hypothetical protein
MVPLRAYETDARFGLLWFGLIEFLNPLSREETKVCNRKLKSIYKEKSKEKSNHRAGRSMLKMSHQFL